MRRFATTLCLALVSTLFSSVAMAANGLPDCEDGIDNDGDNLIDYPADPGCTGPDGTTEVNSPLDGGFDAGFGPIDAGRGAFDAAFDVGTAGVADIGTADVGTAPPSSNGTGVTTPQGRGAVGERPITNTGCEMGVLSEGGTLVVILLITLAIAFVRRRHGSSHRSG